MSSTDSGQSNNVFQCDDSVEKLAIKVGEDWPAILDARQKAQEHTKKLRRLIAELKPPPNTSVVAFGSLAREEWTSGSDVDWTLMIDGPSDMEHYGVTKSVADLLVKEDYEKPGQTGTFGSMVGSHELVHHIGGDEDTNQNMTRRLLLLLESVSLSDSVTQERVIRAILERYIVGDPPATTQVKYHVPLFLLNDIVRFWRTMTVDYATKKWQRSNAGWALRNIKLRMSRKLLFAKGMLICFLCDEDFSGCPTGSDPEIVQRDLLTRCFHLSRCSAIALLADVLLKYATSETATTIMGAYNHFLETIDDKNNREKLNKLEFEGLEDPLFNKQREITQAFRNGLEQLFFESNEQLSKLTRRYGVF